MFFQSARKLRLAQLLKLGGSRDSSVGLGRLFGFEPVDDDIEDGLGMGVLGSKEFDLGEGGGLRGGCVVFEEAAVEFLEEVGLLYSDQLQYFEEGGDGMRGALVLVLPGVEQLLDVVVDVGVVDLAEESLRVLLHLLGGQHLYKLNVIEVAARHFDIQHLYVPSDR